MPLRQSTSVYLRPKPLLPKLSERCPADFSCIVLGGDSAGAQLAAQFAAKETNAELRARMRLPRRLLSPLKGVALVSGRSIYLHKSPIAGMIKFSIDLGADINYAQYLPAEGDYNMDSSLTEDIGIGISGRHHLDIGMFLGPAVSVNPVGDLMVTAYFRFVPSYSAFLMDVDAYHGFTPFFTYGGEVTWKWIGLGVEGRSGYGSYSSIMSLFNGGESMKTGYATQAVRCYISFRF